MKLLVIILTAVYLSACASTVEEVHYFTAYDDDEKPVNFYRLSVNGQTDMSRSRYVSGYYDERAVDLFFNEIKVAKATDDNSKLFLDDQESPGTGKKLTPLNPTSNDGAFLLVLSNNADSIVNAIGSFAESQVVAQSLSALLMKDRYKEKLQSDAKLSVERMNAAALKAHLTTLLTTANAAATEDESKSVHLSILSALARELGHDATFESFEQARTWFSTERNVANAQ